MVKNKTRKINKVTIANKNNKQSGIALLDVVVALVIVGIIISVVYSVSTSAKSSLSQKQVTEEVKGFFPVAVGNCLSRKRGDLSHCDTATIITASISPLSSTATPCGDVWSAVATAPSIVVTYPLDQCGANTDRDAFGASLAADLNPEVKINASYDAASDELTITYLR